MMEHLRRVLRVASPVLVALTGLTGTAGAQISSRARTRTESPPLAAAEHGAHATISALALRFRSGSGDDPAGAEGAAWLLADALVSQANTILSPLQSTLTEQVDRGTTVYTLVAPPEMFGAARAIMDSVLFRAPLDPAVLQARRTALLDELGFETNSPVADVDREAATILADPGSAFTRPPRGLPESIATLDGQILERYRGTFYRPERAAVATVTPAAGTSDAVTPDIISPGTVAPDTLAPDIVVPSAAAPDTAARDTAVTDSVAPDIAWRTGSRRALDRDVTSTWITVAYPAPTDLARTSLELLAFALDEDLDPTPPDPDRYGVAVRIEDTPHGAVLLVEATVFPDAADRWEAKITSAVTHLSAAAQDPDFFAWRRRRFRAQRLIDDAAPEARAARMTADLVGTGTPRDLDTETWQLDPNALRDAARALGEPRIFRYGPDLQGASDDAGRG